ncbi:hypothetical protein Tco_0245739 [Tanacetum coccineum]
MSLWIPSCHSFLTRCISFKHRVKVTWLINTCSFIFFSYSYYSLKPSKRLVFVTENQTAHSKIELEQPKDPLTSTSFVLSADLKLSSKMYRSLNLGRVTNGMISVSLYVWNLPHSEAMEDFLDIMEDNHAWKAVPLIRRLKRGASLISLYIRMKVTSMTCARVSCAINKAVVLLGIDPIGP